MRFQACRCNTSFGRRYRVQKYFVRLTAAHNASMSRCRLLKLNPRFSAAESRLKESEQRETLVSSAWVAFDVGLLSLRRKRVDQLLLEMV